MSLVPSEGRRLIESLETGAVDVAIVPRIVEPNAAVPSPSGSSLLRRTLFHDHMVCFLRAGHPALGGKRKGKRGGNRASPRSLSIEAYAALSHALVSPTGEGPGLADMLLTRHGLSRRIALRIPHFYSALAIVANSDVILTAPAGLARLASEGVAVVALPRELTLPSHAVDQVWHERFSSDPGHTWLRDLLSETARQALADD
jgi:DNA-binding transcriptional LysR family regulator